MRYLSSFLVVASIVASIVAGSVSALWMSGILLREGPVGGQAVSINQWQSNWDIGSRSTSPYVRAYVAKHGVLGLPKSEAVYFIARVDDEGLPLRETCEYILSGGGQAAAWWSITLYDDKDLLPLNEDGALSIDQTRVGEGAWSVPVQSTPPKTDQLWISSNNAGVFDVMIRLYKPAHTVLSDPERYFQPPSIQRTGCKGDGS